MDGARQRRGESRRPILAHVHWMSIDSEGVEAELCDVSSTGFFLTSHDSVPGSAHVGDPVWIVLSRDGVLNTLAGTVRWRGFSQTHGCMGCGVLLDRASVQLASALFPGD